MAKKVPAKTTRAAKKAAPAAKPKARAAARPSTAKYDQPGAPWWKKTPLPKPKG